MRRITTPVLCVLLGLLMVFVVLVDVSGASADDDDDDDRRSYRYSEWRHHGHHHGKKHWHHRHGHYHWHCGDDDDCEYDDDDDDDDDFHRHGKGYGHRHHGRHESRRGSDWDYLEDDQAVEIEPIGPVIWRNPDTTLPNNPPAPLPPRKTETEISGEYASGPCREYYTTARVGGRIQQIYGHACRQPDGSWKFMR